MSDKDFFYDEDGEPTEDQTAKPEAARKQPAAASRPKAAASTGAGGQTVSTTIAGLIGVVALLVGMIVGMFIPVGGDVQTPPPSAAIPGAGGAGQARPLTPEELQQGMPAGHPPVEGSGTATPAPGAIATPTPEAQTP